MFKKDLRSDSIADALMGRTFEITAYVQEETDAVRILPKATIFRKGKYGISFPQVWTVSLIYTRLT